MRAIRVFRDKSSLSVTPSLWNSIRTAISDSEYFILLASPDAANSKWIQKEIDLWITTETRKVLQKVEELAIRFEDIVIGSVTFSSLSQTYARLGDHENSQLCLERALNLALSIRDKQSRFAAFSSVLRGCSEIHDLEKSAQILSQILIRTPEVEGALEHSSDFFWFMAQRFIKESDLNAGARGLGQLLAKASQIVDERIRREHILPVLIQSYSSLGSAERAKEFLRQALLCSKGISGEESRSWAFSFVATSWRQLSNKNEAQKGLNQVLSEAEKLSSPLHSSDVKLLISSELAQLKNKKEALRILRKARESVRKIGGDGQHSEMLFRTADAFRELGDRESSSKCLKELVKKSKQSADVKKLISAAQGFAWLSMGEEAKKVLDIALDISLEISDLEPLAHSLVPILGGYIHLGAVSRISQLLHRLLVTTVKIPNHFIRERIYSDLTESFVKINDLKLSTDFFKPVFDSLLKIRDYKSRSESLSIVARGYLLSGNRSKAANILEEALETTKKIGSPEDQPQFQRIDDPEHTRFIIEMDQVEVLSFIAQTYAHLHDSEQGWTAINLVLEIAKGFDDLHRSEIYSQVARIYPVVEDIEQSVIVLDQLLVDAIQIDTPWYRTNALVALAGAYTEIEDPDQAGKGLDRILESTSQIDHESRNDVIKAVLTGYLSLRDPELVNKGLSRVVTSEIHESAHELHEEVVISAARGFAMLGDEEQAEIMLGKASEISTSIDDEYRRSKAFAEIALGYLMMMKREEAFDLFNYISIDDDYFRVNSALIESLEPRAASGSQKLCRDWLFRLFPHASQRTSSVFLGVLNIALPAIEKHFPWNERFPIYDFFEGVSNSTKNFALFTNSAQ